MLRFGAMQIDVFSLLTEARQRIAANIAAIEAQRDFWLADANLRAAVVGGEPALSETETRAKASPAVAQKNDESEKETDDAIATKSARSSGYSGQHGAG